MTWPPSTARPRRWRVTVDISKYYRNLESSRTSFEVLLKRSLGLRKGGIASHLHLPFPAISSHLIKRVGFFPPQPRPPTILTPGHARRPRRQRFPLPFSWSIPRLLAVHVGGCLRLGFRGPGFHQSLGDIAGRDSHQIPPKSVSFAGQAAIFRTPAYPPDFHSQRVPPVGNPRFSDRSAEIPMTGCRGRRGMVRPTSWAEPRCLRPCLFPASSRPLTETVMEITGSCPVLQLLKVWHTPTPQLVLFWMLQTLPQAARNTLSEITCTRAAPPSPLTIPPGRCRAL